MREEAPSVSARRRADPPPPVLRTEGGKSAVVCLHRAKRGEGGLRQRRKTEGGVCQLALHAFGTALSQTLEVVEKRCGAAEAREDLPWRFRAVEQDQFQALCVDEGKTGNLSGALVDEQLHAMLDDDDMGFDAGAGFRVGEEVVELLRVFEAGDEPVEVFARDLAQPRDRVEREQDAQENEEQLGHGSEYDPRSGAG